MIVHQEKKSFFSKPKIDLKLNWTKLKPLFVFLLVANIVLVGFGLLFIKTKIPRAKQILNLYIKENISMPVHRLFFTVPEKINVEINFESLQKIEGKRQEAITKGILLTDDDDFVPAKIVFEGEKIPIKLRLKGDWVDHLQGEKWSFRVHTKNDEALLGMRYFSLQAPETRHFINEWLALSIMDQEGLIALRYKFIEVSINGERKGIYALEEHFSKELIENNQRREGPIVKFSEDLHWANLLKYRATPNEDADTMYRSLIEPFRGGKTLGDPVLYGEFQEAQRLLQDFRNNKVGIEQVFDLEQWGKFFALLDLFGSGHGSSVHNLRFYYNPITGLLEPIPFDLMTGDVINKLNMERENLLTDFPQFWQNKTFQKEYLFYLDQYSRDEFVDSFLEKYKEELGVQEKIINLDELYKFDFNFLHQNKKFIQKKLSDAPALKIIKKSNGQLLITPLTQLPVEILNLSDDKDEPLYIAPAFQDSLPESVEVWPQSDLQKIKYRFLGTKQEFDVELQNWVQSIKDNRFVQTTSRPYFVKFDFTENVYRIGAGKWQLSQPLVIPQNSKLIIEAGAQLDLIGSSYIVSYSPIFINGLAENMVKINSSDGTGGGILVIGNDIQGEAMQTSKISHTQFSNLSNISALSNNITGAVTLYEADVEIKKSLFENNNSEDMLNIVRSNFLLDGVVFKNSFSDAFDADFSRGKIINSKFSNLTNDAIDVSGSNLEVQNVQIDTAGDKGVSAGEQSQVLVENSRITNSQIGFASKDSSELTVKLSNIIGGKYGFVAYQKKQEYGGGTIESWGCGNGAQFPWWIEIGSSFSSNGLHRLGDQKNVYERLLDLEQSNK
jgi:hypothetical protein